MPRCAVTGGLAHEFQRGQAGACQEPVPHVNSSEHDAKCAFRYLQEMHYVAVIAVVVVFPHAQDREEEVSQATCHEFEPRPLIQEKKVCRRGLMHRPRRHIQKQEVYKVATLS